MRRGVVHPMVRLEPAIYRLQLRVFYQQSHSGPLGVRVYQPLTLICASPQKKQQNYQQVERWIFNNRGAILNLIHRLLGPPLLIPWWSEVSFAKALLFVENEIFLIEMIILSFYLPIVHLWLDFGLPPRFPQGVWYHWGKMESFSATLAHDGLAECDQPGKNP